MLDTWQHKMHSIRSATLNDAQAILSMGQKFHSIAGFEFNYDHISVLKTIQQLIVEPNGILLIAESEGVPIGMIGGLIYPHYMDNSHLTGQELFFWVNPEKRGSSVAVELLKSCESTAKERGAQSFSMMSLANVNPEKANKLYLKLGYKPLEHTFTKSL